MLKQKNERFNIAKMSIIGRCRRHRRAEDGRAARIRRSWQVCQGRLHQGLRVWINKTRFENQVREWTGKLSPAQDLWVFVTHWPPPGTCHALAGRAEGCSPLGLSHCPTCLTAALGSHASPPPVHAREWGCPQLWFSLRLCFLVLLLSGLPGL